MSCLYDIHDPDSTRVVRGKVAIFNEQNG